MKREVRVLPGAEAELAAAATWYEARGRGLGFQLLAAVEADVERIAHAPEAFPLWLEGRPYRKLVIHRFPYIMFFRLVGDEIEIVALAHAKRSPGYWLDRQR